MPQEEIQIPEVEKRRLKLQALLEQLLGSENVYFQPPSENAMVRLNYPCIVYQLADVDTKYSQNKPYVHFNRYSVTYIDRLPDRTVPERIAALETAAFDRFYTTDGLNHYIYRLYDSVINELKGEYNNG